MNIPRCSFPNLRLNTKPKREEEYFKIPFCILLEIGTYSVSKETKECGEKHKKF